MSTSISEGAAARASVDAVLGFAWDAGVFTSGDAMPAVGLTRSTTIEAVDELVARRLLRELPNARASGDYRKGRPARRFELRADAAVVVGVDAGRGHVTAAVADLRGESIARETVEVDEAEDSDRRGLVTSVVDSALKTAGCERQDVLSVSVGVPAPVDAAGESPASSDGFWRRMNPRLGDALSQWAPIVRVDNDASLAALAERTVGAAVGCRNHITLLAGERFGVGVVIDGRVLRGMHGGVGEPQALDHVIGVENAWGIGHRVAKWAREDIAADLISADHPLAQLHGDRLTGRAVLELAIEGDPDAQRIVQRAGAVLARVGGVLGSLFDPERIVISGAIAAGMADVIAIAEELLPHELGLPAPQLIPSTLGSEVVAIGAVYAAIESARKGVLALPTGQLPSKLR